jgi:hypothetical protein
MYEEDLPKHYIDSKMHPSCCACHVGFEDDLAYDAVSPGIECLSDFNLFLAARCRRASGTSMHLVRTQFRGRG